MLTRVEDTAFRVSSPPLVSYNMMSDDFLRARLSTIGQSSSSVMAAPPSAYKDRHFLAIIGDEVACLCHSP